MPPKRKVKKEEQPDDEFMTMTPATLEHQLQLYKEKCNEIKSKRNYVQMDRDMTQQLYQNTQKQVKQTKIDLFNLQADAEKLEKDHTVQVKMYLQRLKLLQFQQERSNNNIQKDGQNAKTNEIGYFTKQSQNLVKSKLDLKKMYVQAQKKQNDVSEFLQADHHQKQALFERDFEKQLIERQQEYKQQLAKLKQQLDLKFKVQIHEVQQRKNLHINELIKNHQQGFRQLQDFYNTITSQNLKVIRDHKITIKKMNEQSSAIRKVISDITMQNNKLRGPLKQYQQRAEKLRYLLRQFEKHKEGLKNLRSKKVTLKQKYLKIQKSFSELDQEVVTANNKKQNLQNNFERMTEEIRRDAEHKNQRLNNRLQSLLGKLEQKQGILSRNMEEVNVDPQTIEHLSERIRGSLQSKNQAIRNLQYNIHHATKAYNDAVRVYEAKLVEFGIPAEELGFQPLLDTPTSTMPAGLVSS